jgi:hypothetical protein
MSSTRTWKCPDCGQSVNVDYDWIAEHGMPVCEKCDCDMELQPAAGDDGLLIAAARPAEPTTAAITPKRGVTEEQIQRLVAKAEAAGLQAEDLDELVHELASSIAADINNDGMDAQLRYLAEEMGLPAAEKQLDEQIEARSEEEP